MSESYRTAGGSCIGANGYWSGRTHPEWFEILGQLGRHVVRLALGDLRPDGGEHRADDRLRVLRGAVQILCDAGDEVVLVQLVDGPPGVGLARLVEDLLEFHGKLRSEVLRLVVGQPVIEVDEHRGGRAHRIGLVLESTASGEMPDELLERLVRARLVALLT